jgi:hypothetical protein
LFSGPTDVDQIGRTTSCPPTGVSAGVAPCSRRAEHLVPPDRHADDQHQQCQRSQRDRHVDQDQITGHRTSDQQADRDGYDGHECAEPDHLEAPR